jgi:Holliday junction resolvasome RuvABC endonuclease subunit
MEDGFSGTNRKTSMQLSYLRGGLTLLLRHNKILVEKQLPSTIRKNIGVGGNAKKEQVAEKVSIIYQNNVLLNQIGPYSDKQNKNKTSDIYDAISIAYSYCV